MTRTNPATEESLSSVASHDGDDVETALATASETFWMWRDTDLRERRRLLETTAEVLRDRTDEFARLATKEMGKPIDGARAEIEKCAWVCDHYA